MVQKVWTAWDGHHYVFLAQHGYVTQGDEANFIVFFPLYPLLIRIASYIFQDTLLTGVIVSNVFSILAHTLYFEVLRLLGYSFRQSVRIFLLFLFNPIAVYFAHSYTESLFLFCTVLGMYFLYTKKYFASTFSLSLSVLTRMTGIFSMIPYYWDLVVHLWEKRSFGKEELKRSFYGLLMPVALLLYFGINVFFFHNPFYFLQVQRVHWHKQAGPVLSQYRNEWRSFQKDLLQNFPTDFPTYFIDRGSTLIAPIVLCTSLVLLILEKNISRRNRLNRIGIIIWGLATWFLIASQTFWLSSARYVFLIFGVTPALEHLVGKNSLLYFLTLIASSVLFFYGIFLFSKGAWLY